MMAIGLLPILSDFRVGLDYNSSFEFVSSSDDLPDELPTMLYVVISCMLLHDAVGRWSAR